MESLEQLQRQLSTLGELRSIVKTMKALSAASIRQYESAVDALERYAQTIERGLYVLVRDMHTLPNTPAKPKNETVLAIVFGSDHGLCGRFNEVISAFTLSTLSDYSNQASGPQKQYLMTVGTRVTSTLEHHQQSINKEFKLPSTAAAVNRTVQEILLEVDQYRERYPITKVCLFYNKHSKGQAYEAYLHVLLPVDIQGFKRLKEGQWPSHSLPTYSMPLEQLLSKLIEQYLFVSIFRACTESQASEHASRLSAMKSAQRNLDDRLQDVTMNFRHARQAEITNELLDVLSGFETITKA
ncbi:MAG: F-type H+-transporting ATPase subunit gamma [Gammaproteobacteria bacterium]|jgi:F-type H+-transporting ATPase subunit gamma